MMPEQQRFISLCEAVRFELDAPREQTRLQRGIADFVAQVRATGLQVTRATVPRLNAVVERVAERLELRGFPSVYVVNDPVANAFAPSIAGGQTPVIVLNSGLVTLLSPNELEFAIGHELGHLGLRHGIDENQSSPPNEFVALQVRSLQRYAEVSADRVGLLATRSVFTSARVMIKIASGLQAENVAFDIEAFIQQAERDPDELSREWELDLSHPSLPFRLWALLRFSHCAEYSRLAEQGDLGVSISQVDQEVAERFAAMGDGRLDAMETNVYQLALVWAALAMVMDDGMIGSAKRDAFTQIVGIEHAEKALAFAENHDRSAVFSKLAEATERVNAASFATRQRFLEAVENFALLLGMSLSESQAGRLLAQTLQLR
jgi:hypothetical protein